MYINDSAIERIKEIGGDALVEKMIQLFLNHAPKNYQLAQEARQELDLKQLSDSVHAIKSSAGNFGAHPLFNAAENIERLAREGKAEEAIQGMVALDECFNNTIQAMKTILVERN
ncbi:MAG: Hpt domain-containing protein [Candidatus Hinthialibacter antarcticus]|nr:Hpt domain-containing protein [Candidatus Hinthialibacter antarcticus]